MAVLERGVVSIASLVPVKGLVDGIAEALSIRMVASVESLLGRGETKEEGL
jgi:hypothetical protein